MKNVLIIEGSPRRNQNSDVLSNQFMKGAEEAGHNVKKIYLNQANVHGCIGCNMCRKTGNCVFKDDAVEINKEILNADVVVFVSPVYWYSVTSQLKAVIDRTYAIENEIQNKDLYFIMTCAAPYEEPYKDKLEYAVNVIRGYADCLDEGTTLKGVIMGDGFDKNDTTHHAYQDAYEAGKNI